MSRFRVVAAAHVAPVFMDASASVEKAIDWIARAAADGVELIVFPEVFLPGFPYWINLYAPLLQAELNRRYQDQSVERDGPEIAKLRQAAREHGIAVVIGASERGENSRTCYNSSVMIDRDGGLLGVHRKIKPTYAERYIWGQGDGSGLIVADSSVGRLGVLACWEHTMNLARQSLIEDGEEVHAGLWPGLSTMAGFDAVADIQIEAMMRNHALTGQCFVIAASSPVTQAMLDFLETELGPQTLMGAGGGWSAIIHPFATTVAGPVTGTDECLVRAQIDLDDIKSVKVWVDTAGHYARPDMLRLQVNRRALTTRVDMAGTH
ncbi:carbon-nitrogen hydrolase family protein [Sphingomonas bacterium]|uniref:carbon-nitrogen hydrolase family protein n=1 Tax=Sphingomonas bacterium TaxID=1895847 RepID=UPI001576BE43|nr:carbon-nitrogen hydrolase family protein [Sphingomonas bacterium]